MQFTSLLLLAVGLAMDSMAVSATRGLAVQRIEAGHVARVALCFGSAHVLLPLLGWLLGSRVGPAVAAWDHWIAFVLLGGIGAKMVYEALTHDADEGVPPDPFATRLMIALALATSIDAFAVGVTLPLLGAPLLLSLATIGAVTAALSVVGLYAGRRFGALLGPRLEVAGGAVLILLGSRILADHMGWLPGA